MAQQMDPAIWPLLYVGIVPLSLLLATFSLFQFSQLYTLIVRIGARSSATSIWRFFKPYHKKLVSAYRPLESRNPEATLA